MPFQINWFNVYLKTLGAVYISTEDIFPSKRFHQLAEHFKLTYHIPTVDIEDNLYLSHAADYEQLRRRLSVELPRLLSTRNIGLVVIDSIAGVFRSENETANYTSRGQEIAHIAHILNTLNDKYNFAVVCSNQVSDFIEID